MDSVSGSQRNNHVHASQEQQIPGQVEQTSGVSVGHDQNNSISHARTGGGYIQGPPADYSPPIPEPNSASTATGEELSDMRTQSLASQSRAGLVSSLDWLKLTQPELLTPEVQDKFSNLENKLGSITSAPENDLLSILESTTTLAEDSLAGVLDSDKLDQILMELEDKLSKNTVKTSEIEIKARADEAQQLSTSNIKNIREYIDNANEDKVLFGLKIALAVLFPPLGAWEAIAAVDREVTKSDSGLSVFSSSQARSEAFDDLKNKNWNHVADDIVWTLGWDIESGKKINLVNRSELTAARKARVEARNNPGEESQAASAPKTPAPTSTEAPPAEPVSNVGTPAEPLTRYIPPDAISTTIQAQEVAQEVGTVSDFMKLIQKLQEADENSEKLQEAIAAFESGDIQAMADILGQYNDSLGTQDLGEALTTDATAQKPFAAPEQPGDIPDSGQKESNSESTIPQRDAHQAYENTNSLTDSLSEVSEQTGKAHEDKIRQNGLVRRFGAA